MILCFATACEILCITELPANARMIYTGIRLETAKHWLMHKIYNKAQKTLHILKLKLKHTSRSLIHTHTQNKLTLSSCYDSQVRTPHSWPEFT